MQQFARYTRVNRPITENDHLLVSTRTPSPKDFLLLQKRIKTTYRVRAYCFFFSVRDNVLNVAINRYLLLHTVAVKQDAIWSNF